MCSTVTLLWHYLYPILWRAGRDAGGVSEVLLGQLVQPSCWWGGIFCHAWRCSPVNPSWQSELERGLAVVWHWIWPVHPVAGCSVAGVAWCSLYVHKHQGDSTSEDLLLILPANMKLLKCLYLTHCLNTWASDSDLGYQHGWHLCVCCLSWVCSQHGPATNPNVDENFLDMMIKFWNPRGAAALQWTAL